MLVLDVGCGANPRGDVNLDLSKTFPIDLIADLDANLPFRDDSFDKAIAFHVLEHLKYPCHALLELVRVARLVEIRVPHRHSTMALPKRSGHIQFFKPIWFRTFAKKHGLMFSVSSQFRCEKFTHWNVFPIEIWCLLWRERKAKS